MKAKIKKTDNGLIVDYFKAKEPHLYRIETLKFIFGMAHDSLTFFVDTNIFVKKIEIEQIKALLDEVAADYCVKKIQSTEKKLFGIPFSLKKKDKPQEYLIAAKIDKDNFSDRLYDEFLRYYDYGIGMDTDKKASELIELHKDDYQAVLFNKEVLGTSFYDSILFLRLRTDCFDESLAEYLGSKTI